MSTKNMTAEEVERRTIRLVIASNREARRLKVRNRPAARKFKRETERAVARVLEAERLRTEAELAEKKRLRRLSRLKPAVKAKKLAQKRDSKPSEAKSTTKPRVVKKRS